MSKKQNKKNIIFRRLVIGLAWFGGFFLGYTIVLFLTGAAYKPEMRGFVISRDNYIANCYNGDPKVSRNIDRQKFENYCGCVYDRGMNTMGKDIFMEKSLKLEQTGDYSDFQDLINECLVELR